MFNKIGRSMLMIGLVLVVGAGMAYSADFLSLEMRFGGKGDPSYGGDHLIDDVYFDGKGNLYFVDKNNYKILKYNAEGEQLMSFGKFGAANGTLNSPREVAVDSKGNIFVLDFHDHDYVTSRSGINKDFYRVQKFNSSGKFLWSVGKPGRGKGGFYGTPSDIDVDKEGNLYVLDEGNFRVQKFNRNGKFVLAFGRYGKGEGEFDNPERIVVDQAGDIYVADTYNHRIQKFDKNGKFILAFGKEGSNDGEFKNPTRMYIDAENNLGVVTSYSSYTSGKRRFVKCLIHKFDGNGKFIGKKYAIERYYDDYDTYSLNFLNLDPNDNLYLFHTRDKTVNKYKFSSTFINWGSMTKNYTFELRKPTDKDTYHYESTTSTTDNLKNLAGWRPWQRIIFDYDIDDRTGIRLQNDLTYSILTGPRQDQTGTTISSWEGTKSSLNNTSSIRWDYRFDKTKDKYIEYEIGYTARADKDTWLDSTTEDRKYNYDRIYSNVNVDVGDFSDVEFGYYKTISKSGNEVLPLGYINSYDYLDDYMYIKYHTDF
jgi:NHL repeat